MIIEMVLTENGEKTQIKIQQDDTFLRTVLTPNKKFEVNIDGKEKRISPENDVETNFLLERW
jgi:hypothetical protein